MASKSVLLSRLANKHKLIRFTSPAGQGIYMTCKELEALIMECNDGLEITDTDILGALFWWDDSKAGWEYWNKVDDLIAKRKLSKQGI